MNPKTSVKRTVLLQDLGMLLFMASLFAAALITALTGRDLLYQNVVLLACLMLTALLVILRAQVAGAILTAVVLLGFAVYKVYVRMAYGTPIELTAYLWPLLQVGALGGATLFISLYATMEGVNRILNRRINELTVMDPLTGLENQRSMLMSLRRYMALCERNGDDMGLMLIRLRYAEELRKVLSANQFNELRARLAETIQHMLRLEDRLFTMDENGTMGLIYFSKAAGEQIIKNRILNAVQSANMLPDLNEQMLVVELSIVFRHYDASYGKDAMRYLNEVEKEFAYEV